MDLPLSCNTKPFKASGRRRRRKCSGDLTPATSSSSSSKRSSIYKGVTRHRLTGRYEAHIWDKSYWNKSQNRKGKQVYLGAYNNEETAARNYDLAALKYWGTETMLNFPAASYAAEYKEMQGMSKEDYLALLRRRSSGFSRGASKYRGVARHHYNGRWEARIGRINGDKYLYLGTFSSEEEAAQAYDRAALIYRGPRAMTNFDMNQYAKIQTQKTQLLSLLQAPPCCQQQQHQDITHPIMLSEPTCSFSGAMATMEDTEEFSWSSIMNSSFETFSIPDLIIDMNVPDDIDELINNIEWLADESSIGFFEANSEEIGQRSIATTAIDSSNSQIISTSLIGGQQLVEEEVC